MEDLPEYLFRVTKPDYKVDREGYILNHNHNWGRATDIPEGPLERSYLFFTHPTEWQVIARFLAFPSHNDTLYDNGFRLLKVPSNRVENLKNHEDHLLSFGKFSGKLQLSEIVSDHIYDWTRTLRIDLPEAFRYREFTVRYIKTLGWRPYCVEEQDELLLLDRLFGVPKSSN